MATEAEIAQNAINEYLKTHSGPPTIWLNPFFYVGIGLFLILVFYIIYHYISLQWHKRTVVRIHMPDNTLMTHSFKDGQLGTEFKMDSGQKTQDGTKILYTYFVRPEAIEQGRWGRYIDYDFGKSEPLNPKQRAKEDGYITNILKFVSGLLDTDLAVDLLLSQKFKNLVTTLLTVILIVSGIILLGVIGNYFYVPPQKACVLAFDNQTINVIKYALLPT